MSISTPDEVSAYAKYIRFTPNKIHVRSNGGRHHKSWTALVSALTLRPEENPATIDLESSLKVWALIGTIGTVPNEIYLKRIV